MPRKILLILLLSVLSSSLFQGLANTVHALRPLTDGSGFELSMRLKIPSLQLDALIEAVGLTATGAMDVPKDAADVAWFERGPRPGETGSAVIDGHSGIWKNGTVAVFNGLSELKPGDELFVEDSAGVINRFVVREVRSYDWNADASDVFKSNDGKAHLNLITCEGVWNTTQDSYPKRLVVFTDKE